MTASLSEWGLEKISSHLADILDSECSLFADRMHAVCSRMEEGIKRSHETGAAAGIAREQWLSSAKDTNVGLPCSLIDLAKKWRVEEKKQKVRLMTPFANYVEELKRLKSRNADLRKAINLREQFLVDEIAPVCDKGELIHGRQKEALKQGQELSKQQHDLDKRLKELIQAWS